MWTWWLGFALAGDVAAVLDQELARALVALSDEEGRPHYVGLTVLDEQQVEISGSDGTLFHSGQGQLRLLDVDLRVGTAELDSTHPLRGDSSFDSDERGWVRLALDGAAGPGDPGGGRSEDALRRAIWREVDGRYRAERERLVMVDAERVVLIEEENPAPDFEPRVGQQSLSPVPALQVDRGRWEQAVARLSAVMMESSEVYGGRVWMQASRRQWTMVDSEGAHLVHGGVLARLGFSVRAIAEDGDRVELFRSFDAHDVAGLPDPSTVEGLARQLGRDVVALAHAPRVGPYTGPVWLSGRAAAVFFHEVMGHRVEGHRQKRDDEGKTFLEYLGRPVLPTWIDVVDDPTRASAMGVDLNGYYTFDDEGVPAQPAVLVEDGVFRGFLMGRSPIEGFEHSNGHGRRSSGNLAQPRMANTLVTSSKMLSEAELRAAFVKELRAQGLPYGYRVEEIDGGFTFTGRSIPNAFNVTASRTWRVHVDGRPDELVRGIDLVGTPLVAFQSVVATGGQVEVFNGYCGAESGWVPVSGVAPGIVFRRLEFQLQDKSSARPPLLPRPMGDGLTVSP